MIRICKYVLSIIAIILSSGYIFSFVAIGRINILILENIDGKLALSSNTTTIRSAENFNSSGKENENQQNDNKVAAADGHSSSTKGRWIPLTNAERIQYNKREKRVCNNPFQHCCIGQGRQLVSKHSNISQLYVKWSKPTFPRGGSWSSHQPWWPLCPMATATYNDKIKWQPLTSHYYNPYCSSATRTAFIGALSPEKLKKVVWLVTTNLLQ